MGTGSFAGGHVATRSRSAPADPSFESWMVCGAPRPSGVKEVSVNSACGRSNSDCNVGRGIRKPHCSMLDPFGSTLAPRADRLMRWAGLESPAAIDTEVKPELADAGR